jgi:uncharacterized protein
MVDELPMSDAIQIPPARLSPGALERLIEEFILRDGTDYGANEQTLRDKTADIRRQLDPHEVFIVFEPETESPALLPGDIAP